MPAAAARTLTLVNTLATAAGGLTFAELARRTGIARASLGRLLDSLVSEQIVLPSSDGSHYAASLRIWEPAASLLTEGRVREIAFPYMVELSHALSNQVNLSLPELPEIVGIETVTAFGDRVTSRLLCSRHPALENASGRVIAAFVAETTLDRIFAIPREKRTANSKIEESELRAELGRIRETGFATNDREQDPNVSGIAVPLFDGAGCPAGALGLSRRLPLDQAFVETAAPQALAVAQRISAELGFRRTQRPHLA